LKNNKYEVDVD